MGLDAIPRPAAVDTAGDRKADTRGEIDNRTRRRHLAGEASG